MISRFATKARLGPEDVDDACQQGVFWLRQAITRYDPGKHAAFSTFLSLFLRHGVADFARRLRRQRKRYAQTSGQAGSPWDQLPDRADENRTYWERIQEMLDLLPNLGPADRAICAAIMAGKPHHELAAEEGICCKTVQRRCKKLLAKLRRKLGSGA